MNTGETIRARVELPCSIRLDGSELRIAHGVTEELTRESLIVVTPSIADSRWLKTSANVSIAVELPVTGTFEPRVLECAASISRVRAFSSGVRIVATVHRMAVVNRDPETRTRTRCAGHSHAVESVPAIEGSQNDNPVIHLNHRTNSNSNSNLRGDNTMSFLKNFFVEEDGQDMVEYGLVLAAVVAAGTIIFTAFGTNVKAGWVTIETAVTAAL
jgi:Flp pilus assembly pilin Flp